MSLSLKRTLIIAVPIVFLGGAVIGRSWWLFRPHVQKTSRPVTREIALRHLSQNLLPSSAHGIQYYCWDMEASPGFEECIRFEAPLADCHAFAEHKFAKLHFAPATPSSPPELHVAFPDWFDTNRISKGIVGGKGYDGEPRIWIDEERGVLYYYRTD